MQRDVKRNNYVASWQHFCLSNWIYLAPQYFCSTSLTFAVKHFLNPRCMYFGLGNLICTACVSQFGCGGSTYGIRLFSLSDFLVFLSCDQESIHFTTGFDCFVPYLFRFIIHVHSVIRVNQILLKYETSATKFRITDVERLFVTEAEA
jgi:hypothetical protein